MDRKWAIGLESEKPISRNQQAYVEYVEQNNVELPKVWISNFKNEKQRALKAGTKVLISLIWCVPSRADHDPFCKSFCDSLGDPLSDPFDDPLYEIHFRESRTIQLSRIELKTDCWNSLLKSVITGIHWNQSIRLRKPVFTFDPYRFFTVDLHVGSSHSNLTFESHSLTVGFRKKYCS